MKVVLCTPTYTRPHPAYLDAVEASVPALDAEGIDHSISFRVGSPYISHARAEMLRKAMDTEADVFVFLDHDVSFRPCDLVTLIKSNAEVAAGLYRFKLDEESYMGTLCNDAGNRPVVRSDGLMRAEWVPAGFLKVTRFAVQKMMRLHPELLFGPPEKPSIDLFNHGAHKGLWWGEDYAFSRRWNEGGGDLWVIPDLAINHHEGDKVYPGNFHEFMKRQPGGINHEIREAA